MIQFNEANLSNSSLNNVALANGGIVMKKQHAMTNFAAPFLHNDRTQSFNDSCITWIIARGLYVADIR